MQNELGHAFGQLLTERCTPAVVRAIEKGESPDALWGDLVDSGFLDALVPESKDGAGLGLTDVLPLVQACGYHAMPLPFAETMVARAVLAHEGREWLSTPLPPAAVKTYLSPEDYSALQAALCSGFIAGAAERALKLSLAHATNRSQFGKAIGSFQAVQHQLSVAAEQVCAARIAAQLCFASATHLPDPNLAAMGMVVTGEAAILVSTISHAVHGAIGVSEECDLQLYTRRLLAWRTQSGSPIYWSRQVGQRWWAAGDNVSSVDFARESLGSAT